MHPFFPFLNPYVQQMMMPRGAPAGVMAGQRRYANPPQQMYYVGQQQGPAVGGSVVANVLSAQQKYWLQLRALTFVNQVSQAIGMDPTVFLQELPPVNGVYGRGLVAGLAAVALFGDDYNPVTQNVNQDYNEAGATAAYNYVLQNIGTWFQQVYPPAPSGGRGG